MRRVLASLHGPTIITTQMVDQITALVATITTTVTIRAAVTTTVITVTIIRILKYR